MRTSPVLGVDIGGSHITAALVDIESGKPIAATERRLSVDSAGEADDILHTWCKAISASLNAGPASTPIGIAMPGPFDYEQGISLIRDQNKFRSLYQWNLRHEIAARLDIDPSLIFFMNDACAFLEGEMLGGALRGKQNVMGITLGTGLGSAFSIDSDVIDADLWNSPFKKGIAEDFLSTRWFISRFAQLTGKQVDGVKGLASMAEHSHEASIVFDEFAENLASFMIQQLVQHQYSSIVLGGNIIRAAKYFEKKCQQMVVDETGVAFTLAILGETAPLIGAAGMAARKYKPELSGIETSIQ